MNAVWLETRPRNKALFELFMLHVSTSWNEHALSVVQLEFRASGESCPNQQVSG